MQAGQATAPGLGGLFQNDDVEQGGQGIFK